MEQIYKSKHFGHIDLAKIITISGPILGGASQNIHYKVIVQLRDEPLRYDRRLDDTEMKWNKTTTGDGHNVILTVDGEWKRNLQLNIDDDYTVAEENLQAEINDLVNAWESYCTAHAVSHLPSTWRVDYK